MKVLIVDNVSNVSGAPRMVLELSNALEDFEVQIVAIRLEDASFYTPHIFGVKNNKPFPYYIFGLIKIIFNRKFYNLADCADVIIYNTVLTFPIFCMQRVFIHKSILYLHESHEKNILYRLGFLSLRFSKINIVTPSKNPFLRLRLNKKINIIPNAIGRKFYSPMPDFQPEKYVRPSVLFLGWGRKEKGSNKIRNFCKANPDIRIVGPDLDSVASKIFLPSIYYKHQFFLTIEDKRFWNETFSLVTFEAAASGCIPLMTSKELHEEFWHEFPELLVRSPDSLTDVINRICGRADLEEYRRRIREIAIDVTSRDHYKSKWRELIGNLCR